MAKVRNYEAEIASYKELIKDLTICANQVQKQNLNLKVESKEFLNVNFSNPHNVFGCLIDIYIEYSPEFTTKRIPKHEMLSFAHILCKIIKEQSTKANCSESVYLGMFVYELTEKIQKFDQNLHKVAFFVSNLLELRLLLRNLEKEKSISELEDMIKVLFEHFYELQKEFMSSVLPDAVVYYEALDGFKCEDSFYKKFFNKIPSVLKLVSCIDYFNSMMNYFYFDSFYAKNIMKYILRNINFICFNRILVEKNFLSFNRSTQINFNLNELQKFCQEIGLIEGVTELEQLYDIVKLVNLAKNNTEISVIRKDCSHLNSSQLNMLVSKLEGFYAEIEKPQIEDDASLFLVEPKIDVKIPFGETEFVFCMPKYVPLKYITTILSSL